MKSVALSFAIILCTLCHEVLVVHVHHLEASGVQPGKFVHHFLSTDRDDLSLEQLVTGNARLCLDTDLSRAVVLAMVKYGGRLCQAAPSAPAT